MVLFYLTILDCPIFTVRGNSPLESHNPTLQQVRCLRITPSRFGTQVCPGELKWFKLCYAVDRAQSGSCPPSFQEKALGAFWAEALPAWVLYTEALVQEELLSHIPPALSHELATRLPQPVDKNALPDMRQNKIWGIWGKKSAHIEFKSPQHWVEAGKSCFGLQFGPGFQGGVIPNDVVLSTHCSSVNENALLQRF